MTTVYNPATGKDEESDLNVVGETTDSLAHGFGEGVDMMLAGQASDYVKGAINLAQETFGGADPKDPKHPLTIVPKMEAANRQHHRESPTAMNIGHMAGIGAGLWATQGGGGALPAAENLAVAGAARLPGILGAAGRTALGRAAARGAAGTVLIGGAERAVDDLVKQQRAGGDIDAGKVASAAVAHGDIGQILTEAAEGAVVGAGFAGFSAAKHKAASAAAKVLGRAGEAQDIANIGVRNNTEVFRAAGEVPTRELLKDVPARVARDRAAGISENASLEAMVKENQGGLREHFDSAAQKIESGIDNVKNLAEVEADAEHAESLAEHEHRIQVETAKPATKLEKLQERASEIENAQTTANERIAQHEREVALQSQEIVERHNAEEAARAAVARSELEALEAARASAKSKAGAANDAKLGKIVDEHGRRTQALEESKAEEILAHKSRLAEDIKRSEAKLAAEKAAAESAHQGAGVSAQAKLEAHENAIREIESHRETLKARQERLDTELNQAHADEHKAQLAEIERLKKEVTQLEQGAEFQRGRKHDYDKMADGVEVAKARLESAKPGTQARADALAKWEKLRAELSEAYPDNGVRWRNLQARAGHLRERITALKETMPRKESLPAYEKLRPEYESLTRENGFLNSRRRAVELQMAKLNEARAMRPDAVDHSAAEAAHEQRVAAHNAAHEVRLSATEQAHLKELAKLNDVSGRKLSEAVMKGGMTPEFYAKRKAAIESRIASQAKAAQERLASQLKKLHGGLDRAKAGHAKTLDSLGKKAKEVARQHAEALHQQATAAERVGEAPARQGPASAKAQGLAELAKQAREIGRGIELGAKGEDGVLATPHVNGLANGVQKLIKLQEIAYKKYGVKIDISDEVSALQAKQKNYVIAAALEQSRQERGAVGVKAPGILSKVGGALGFAAGAKMGHPMAGMMIGKALASDGAGAHMMEPIGQGALGKAGRWAATVAANSAVKSSGMYASEEFGKKMIPAVADMIHLYNRDDDHKVVAMAEQVKTMAADPTKVQGVVDKAAAKHDPSVAEEIGKKHVNVIQNAAKWAPAPAVPVTPSNVNRPHAMNDIDSRNFQLYLKSAVDPDSAVDEIQGGVVSPITVAALKDNHPELLEEIRNGILEQVSSGEIVNAQHLQRAALLHGAPLTPTQQPEYVQLFQRAWDQSNRTNQESGAGGGSQAANPQAYGSMKVLGKTTETRNEERSIG
jgi:hypothetical protein